MVNLAIAPYPSFQQVQPPSPSPFSYGIDTFTYLTQHAPAQHWFWIVGLDTFQTLPRWYRISEFAARCQWIVAPRVLPCRQPSDSLPASLNDTEAIAATVAQTMHEQGLRLQWTVLNMPLLPVSSTQLRQQISIPPLSPDGSSFIATWLSSPVIQYINQHQLYRYRRST